MTRSLIDNRAFTLTELMVAVGFSVILFTAVFGFYNVSSQSYTAGVNGQGLQTGANTVLSKIIEGETESGTVYRLSTSSSYMIPNGTAPYLFTCGGGTQTTPCNTSTPSSEIYFCQDSTCTYNDATARWYYLNGAGTTVVYHHPNPNGGGSEEETIYTAPGGSTIKLRFSPAAVAVNAQNNVVEIDVDLTQNVAANVNNSRVMSSGDVSTFVLLRNHP